MLMPRSKRNIMVVGGRSETGSDLIWSYSNLILCKDQFGYRERERVVKNFLVVREISVVILIELEI